jgi:ferredoxin
MRAHIDQEGCIACGQCVAICPEVFHQKDDGIAYVHQDPVPKEAEEGAVTAQESCPVSVIAVEDDPS